METQSIIGITLGFISVILGLVSIFVAIQVYLKTSKIDQKADRRIVEETIKETESEDELDLNSEKLDTALDIIKSNGFTHNPSYYYLQGLKEYKNGFYQDAELYFKKAIEIKNGKYPAALFYLGHTYLKQSESKEDNAYKKAKENFKKASDLGHKYAAKRLQFMETEE